MSDTMHQSDSQYGEIELRNITKEFGEESSVSTVVEDCSFVVERGKFTVLIGPSGCGKTTLIDMMAGYEKPTSGEIKLDGEPIAGSSSERLVVFQETALFPWMTTLDNIMYGPRVQRERSEKDIEKEAIELLEIVGLREFWNRYPIQLSGGMQRRAELARALDRHCLCDRPWVQVDRDQLAAGRRRLPVAVVAT